MNSKHLAKNIRKNAIRMVHSARASHIGGVFSCADIVAVLYADVVNVDPLQPDKMERDRVVLSKGHNGVVLYAVLAEMGFFPVEELETYGRNGSKFSCHVSHKGVPGVEISTGSLGQGVCMACGMATNAKLKNENYKVYAIVGDGECNEGSVWETAMFAAQYKLDNFIIVVDCNGMQALGNCDEIINMNSFADKWKAFNWYVEEVDGHNHAELLRAFVSNSEGKPKVILAKTIKGKGVSFMENQLIWHYRDPQGVDYELAMKELETNDEKSSDK